MTMKAAMEKNDKSKGRKRQFPLAPPVATGYPGGKNGAGVYQRLINQIPPHAIYIEPFLGGGAILKAKLPALVSYGTDIDPDVFESWDSWVYETVEADKEERNVFNEDAVFFLNYHRESIDSKTFIYCDPPYIMATRKSGPLYKYEYTDDQHVELLELLLSLDAMVMITGYRHTIYDDALKNWRRMDYMASTRQGTVKESAWMNYDEPPELHDYRFLGKNFRDRERIQRKIKRWKRRLEKLPALEKNAILDSIQCQADA